MGLSRSKLREKKVEEPKKSPTTNFVAKSKDKVMETKQPDQEALNQPAENLLFGAGIAKHSGPSCSSEDKPDTKQKIKKKSAIPQIIITRASNEKLIRCAVPESEEQRTIREQADWGPYFRHRSPSTVAAYDVHNTK